MKINPIAEQALFFRNAAPERFNAFVIALENEPNHIIAAMLQVTPVENVFHLQGRAVQMRWILQILKECHVDRK